MALKEKKYLKTFSIHEKNFDNVKNFKRVILQYKHLENMINILAAYEFNNKTEFNKEILKILLNKIIMKAVLKDNPGGEKTSHNIAQINNYFNNSHINYELFIQAKKCCLNLNDKNIGEIIGRLYKDWNNFFKALSKFYKSKSKSGKPAYPKPKKLNRVFGYSVPLEVSKFSMSKEHKGLLGINLDNKMVYVNYFNYAKNNNKYTKPSYLNKKINSVTVSLSHGHIYYNLQYVDEIKILKNKILLEKELNSILSGQLDSNLVKEGSCNEKVAGLDIGLLNTASIFINDIDTQSLIISGSELISYNCHFNKRIAKTSELIACEVTSYRTGLTKENKEFKVPARYSKKGKKLQYRRSQLFERRSLFMEDYLHKLSRKIANYLIYTQVNKLIISRNLSFAKVNGAIVMNKKTKQKFYQIPFGKLLNLLESKLIDTNIEVVEIDEAYTSKASALTADIVAVQNKAKQKIEILPADLNGSRGNKKKGRLNNPLGRGLFKDMIVQKVVNSDLNAAANHIKVGVPNITINKSLWKYCNPIKIKSNHEFDKVLRSYEIVDKQRA